MAEPMTVENDSFQSNKLFNHHQNTCKELRLEKYFFSKNNS